MTELVTIKRKSLEMLIKDRKELQALDSAGVDNWQGYDWVDWDSVKVTEQDLYEFIQH